MGYFAPAGFVCLEQRLCTLGCMQQGQSRPTRSFHSKVMKGYALLMVEISMPGGNSALPKCQLRRHKVEGTPKRDDGCCFINGTINRLD